MAVVARAGFEEGGSGWCDESKCLQRVVRSQTVPAGTRSVETDTAVCFRDGMANCVIGHAREFLWGLIIKHSLVQLGLRLGGTELCATANLTQCVDRLA